MRTDERETYDSFRHMTPKTMCREPMISRVHTLEDDLGSSLGFEDDEDRDGRLTFTMDGGTMMEMIDDAIILGMTPGIGDEERVDE
ncbi:hypothetical protein Tco_0026868 [Tanacetum coccineum]